jgi:hypothetical protein
MRHLVILQCLLLSLELKICITPKKNRYYKKEILLRLGDDTMKFRTIQKLLAATLFVFCSATSGWSVETVLFRINLPLTSK